jgi:patatin-like phospholipase/acyl hydrolase
MTYRILALSGGGVRGLLQATFLVEAEKWLEEKPRGHSIHGPSLARSRSGGSYSSPAASISFTCARKL